MSISVSFHPLKTPLVWELTHSCGVPVKEFLMKICHTLHAALYTIIKAFWYFSVNNNYQNQHFTGYQYITLQKNFSLTGQIQNKIRMIFPDFRILSMLIIQMPSAYLTALMIKKDVVNPTGTFVPYSVLYI